MPTKQIKVGEVLIGGGAPISIQTMTNTNTENVSETVAQINSIEKAGCDIVRVSCQTKEATAALKQITKAVRIPVVADIHFNYKRAIESIQSGAACIRINPGNMDNTGLKEVAKAAKAAAIPIRIGINAGSLEQEILDRHHESCSDALVESAMLNVSKLNDFGFEQIKISVKSSDVPTCIAAYKKLSKLTNCPLHVGLTEAGPKFSGTIKSAICIGSLLAESVGDTIRVSLSTDPLEEIKVARQILRSFGLLKNSVNIISCPTCARTVIDIINIANEIDKRHHATMKQLNISVLGCVVNGIGEAKKADIGIFGIAKGKARIYRSGLEYKTCEEAEIFEIVEELIDEF